MKENSHSILSILFLHTSYASPSGFHMTRSLKQSHTTFNGDVSDIFTIYIHTMNTYWIWDFVSELGNSQDLKWTDIEKEQTRLH